VVAQTAQKPFMSPLSGCNLKTRQIHIHDVLRSVEPRQDIAQLTFVFGFDGARVVVFVKARQPLMANRPDQLKP
jgi:hypothetical protein